MDSNVAARGDETLVFRGHAPGQDSLVLFLAFHLIDPLNLLPNSFPGSSLDYVFLQQKEICIYEMEANRCVLSRLFIFPMRSDRF